MLQQQPIFEHTTLYRSGQPFPTEAVMIDIPSAPFQPAATLKYFELERQDDQTILRYTLQPQDHVYGLGEQLGGVNKRGRVYKTFNTDIGLHSPHMETLYGSHPFFIVDDGANCFGVFLDIRRK